MNKEFLSALLGIPMPPATLKQVLAVVAEFMPEREVETAQNSRRERNRRYYLKTQERLNSDAGGVLIKTAGASENKTGEASVMQTPPSPPLPPSPLSPAPPIPAPTRTPTPAREARTRTREADDEDFAAASAHQLDLTASPKLKAAWMEWQEYRQRRHRAKGQERLKWSLQAAQHSARQLQAAAAEHGEQIAADRISSAIVGNWQGLNFDRIASAGSRQPSTPNGVPRKFDLF